MRTIVLKLFCWLCLAATATNILAYQNTNSNSKTDYIEAQWRHKLNTKDYSNRYASLLMSSTSGGSTTYKPPWFRSENTKSPSRSSYSYSYSNSNNNNNNNNNAVRLRHSRYPHLDGVMTRLDKMQPTTTAPTTSPPPYKRRYQYQNTKNSDKLFQDNYDDDDLLDYEEEDMEEDDSVDKDNDDLPDYDNWDNEEDDPNNDDLNDDDEDLLDDEDDGWQAEEATEAAPSSLTEYKWQHFGTRSRVEQSRRNQNYPEHSSHYAEINEAIEHALRMNRETRCRQPFPRVLSIQSEHPDPGKSYMPHCTVLHRCAEDTGCCPNHATRCAPRKQTIVYLYFYTTTIGKPGNKVEKLAFYNHTECACLDKSTAPTTLDASESVPESDASREVSRSYRSNLSVRAADASLYSSPETIRRCKCPEEYTPRLHRGSYCTCDCADNNLDCSLIKRGNEFFSLKDRLCILNGQCGIPSCEYGAYMRNVGRCPRKQEKMEAFANVPTHLN